LLIKYVARINHQKNVGLSDSKKIIKRLLLLLVIVVKKLQKKKECFKFNHDHIFLFIALVLNYSWRTLDAVLSANWETLGGFGLLGGKLLGWTPFQFIGWVVWALALYSLYLLCTRIHDKEQLRLNVGLLIFGVLFYLLTIFF
jgi:hypothetical protein